jgi:hypothetical protein
MTKIYNIGIMIDEKNPILNPQAEGSNAASGSKNKGKERASETGDNSESNSSKFRTMIEEVMGDSDFEYDSDISNEYLSDSSEEEFNIKN